MRKNNYANDVAVILLLFIIVLLSGCASSNSNALVTPEIAIHYGEEKTKELEMLCEDTTKISVANQLISKAKRIFELKEQNDIQEDYGALLEYKCSNPDVVKSTYLPQRLHFLKRISCSSILVNSSSSAFLMFLNL